VSIRHIDHVAITVADIETTIAFYRDVLGAQALYYELWREGKIPVVLLQLGGSRLSVHAASGPAKPHARAPTPGSGDLCFRWDAPIAEAVSLLERHGVAVEEGPVPRPAADASAGQSVYFRDPDGNLLELLSTL
jgi:catechol 2,3-dioxygenase-like lactoylglutathione lyase family enzyme